MATSETNWWSPSEMAERTGTTIDTLRYYEKERLITGVTGPTAATADTQKPMSAGLMCCDVFD